MDIQFKQIEGKVIQIYPESFKRKVIEEYLTTGVPKMELLRKYGIKSKSGIQTWMKNLGYTDAHRIAKVKFRGITIDTLAQEIPLHDSGELQKKIKELERQLEDEKLRSEAYLRIIEKAEKELKISIKKKPGTR